VDQAAALIATSNLNAATYLRLLAEQTEQLLALDPGGPYPTSMAAAWAVAFDHLASDHPAVLGLLTLMA
jgi:hypothetical protein